MCNRHVAHVIAEYEAARLDVDGDVADGDVEGGEERSASRDSERASTGRNRLLATVRARLAR